MACFGGLKKMNIQGIIDFFERACDFGSELYSWLFTPAYFALLDFTIAPAYLVFGGSVVILGIILTFKLLK